MKKTIAILVLLIVFTLCACGSETPAPMPTPTPTPTPIPTPTSEPERLWLTNQMIEEIKESGDRGGSLMFVLKVGMGVNVRDIEVVNHEKYDNYTYIYYYRVKYGTPDYRDVYTNLRVVYSAYEDSTSEKGYTIDDHCYEGSDMLW